MYANLDAKPTLQEHASFSRKMIAIYKVRLAAGLKSNEVGESYSDLIIKRELILSAYNNSLVGGEV